MTHEELLKKAKAAASPEEILTLAKENDVPMDEEAAAAYFAKLNQRGELADDELDGVAGGWCYNGGRRVVTAITSCDHWTCPDCHKDVTDPYSHRCPESGVTFFRRRCDCCDQCSYENGLWLCNHPANRE